MGMKSVNLDTTSITVEMAKNRFTRKEICRLTGISESYFSTLMRRERVMPKTAGIIAEALGCDVSMIIKLPENMGGIRDNGEGR